MQVLSRELCYHRHTACAVGGDICGREMGEKTGRRERIVRAAAALLAEGGREAASTRAVAAAAGVTTPTIYRLFGDLRGLLDAVAEFGHSAYLGEKMARERAADPVEELRRGWDRHVGFGLANPAIYRLMLEERQPGAESGASREALGILDGLVSRVAEAGRLRVGVERAVRMIHAAGSGVTLALIGTAPADRDSALSAATREAILAAIITDGPDEGAKEADGRGRAARRAVALKSVLPEAEGALTPAACALLAEWLDAIAAPAR